MIEHPKPSDAEEPGTFRPRATLGLFGHDPVDARLLLVPRSTAWRIRRAVAYGLSGALLAPVVALLPPHAVWALGALTAGTFLAWRSLNSRFAVASLEGSCPRCASPISMAVGTRLRTPHPLSCGDCHHELTLTVDPDDLP